MKTLILVRHAKSDWPENTDDFDRPLSDKGLEDAVKMSKFLKDHHITINTMVSSPAIRALNTCKIFNQQYETDVHTEPKLYNPLESNFTIVVNGLDDALDTVALFSHNNGISNFANSISDHILMFPTCGVAGFQIDTDSWSAFDNAGKKLLFFYEPKKI